MDWAPLSNATHLYVETNAVPDDPGVTATVDVDRLRAGPLAVSPCPFHRFTVERPA